jgi:hypothetical protein
LDWWTGRTWSGGQAGHRLVDRQDSDRQDIDWWTGRTRTGGQAGLGLVDRTKGIIIRINIQSLSISLIYDFMNLFMKDFIK